LPAQRTLKEKISLKGRGLHTGEPVEMEISPAPPGTGFVFVRRDIEGSPSIVASLENVVSTERGTSLKIGEVAVYTVEHVLSALYGMGIDNARIELNAPEPPSFDGSSLPIVKEIEKTGIVEQDVEREILVPEKPVLYQEGGVTITLLPLQGKLRVSYGIDYPDKGFAPQYISLDITPEVYSREIAPARTYVFYDDLEAIRERGLAKGGTEDNAIVFREGKIINGPLRFPDEPVRHKVLDLLGDLALVGKRVEGHVVADRAGHAHHIAFARKLQKSLAPPAFDIMDILSFMPHRYPFLLVDRILEVEENRAVGLKNVTINEPFFQGHFPGDPIMPGVLIVEAMAQVGGVLLLSRVEDRENKLLYFSGIDEVKFRRPVRPGDQIIFEVELLRFKGRMARMRGEARVDGQVAASAVMMAAIVERK